MRKLENCSTEDLMERWDQLLPGYIEQLKELQKLMDQLNIKREELFLIKEELETRNINVAEKQVPI